MELDANFADAHFWLGVTLFHSGRNEEAAAAIQKGLALSGGDMRMRCVLATWVGYTGHKEAALAQLQEILSFAQHRYVSPVHLSQVYFGLGDLEKTFDLLEKGFQERDPALRPVITIPALQDAAGRDPRLRDKGLISLAWKSARGQVVSRCS